MENFTPWHAQVAASLAAAIPLDKAANEPQLRRFRVQIKRGRDVVETYPALGTDSLEVAHNFQRLCGPGQYVRVNAVTSA